MKWIAALGWGVLVSSFVLVCRPTSAEPSAAPRLLELELEAPAHCPTNGAIVEAVTSLVRSAPPAALAARAVIAEREGRFQVELATSSGRRRFEGASCRAVSEALVVILALTIDPGASTNVAAFAPLAVPLSSERAVAEEPERPRPAPAKRAVLATRPVERPDRADAPWRFGGAALLVSEIGILPGPALGAFGLVHAGQRAWRAELGGGFLLPRSETLLSGAGGKLSWASGQANACWIFHDPLAACAGVEIGRISGRGFAVDRARSAETAWIAAVVSASARMALAADVAFEARLALSVPQERRRFGVDGQPLHRPGPISARALIGVAFR